MAYKERKTTLYSRNGIRIVKEDMLDTTRWSNKVRNYSFWDNIRQQIVERTEPIIHKRKPGDSEYEYETKTSPLGFYYTVKHYIGWKRHNGYVEREQVKYAKYRTIGIQFEKERYELEYPIAYKEISINNEMRPWDLLPGYKGISDHFINDLQKELDKFFNVISDNKKVLDKAPEDIERLKRQVFKDIFGDERGPQITMNDIKILSHGFDLKESFRKRKES